MYRRPNRRNTVSKKQTSMRFREETLNKLQAMAYDKDLSQTALVDRLITAQWEKNEQRAGAASTDEREFPYPDPFEASLKLLGSWHVGAGQFLEAARNVHDTFSLACKSLAQNCGKGYTDADAIALLRLMMERNAQLEAAEGARRNHDEETGDRSQTRHELWQIIKDGKKKMKELKAENARLAAEVKA
jgi:hypothetical protein